tara:strand:- start:615 stop:806 length:192 start_codon:yes stop_codon:yes gene_type:complete
MGETIHSLKERDRLRGIRDRAYIAFLQRCGKASEVYRQELDIAQANLDAYEKAHDLDQEVLTA